jgi:hypothetical protein
MPMPVQSYVPSGEFSGVVVFDDAAAIVGTRVVGVSVLPSVMVTLDTPMGDADTEDARVVAELEELDVVKPEDEELEEDVDVDVNVDDEVNEVAIPLVSAKDAEATKSQLLATNSKLWLLQQFGPVSTQQNAGSLFCPTTPPLEVQLYILPNLESEFSTQSTLPSFLSE